MSAEERTRTERHDTIRRLIESCPIRTQQELADALRLRGYAVTQSSVSRDLNDLGVVKVGGRYAVLEETGRVLSRRSVLSATPAGPYLLVVRTPIGAAQRVAYTIDEADLDFVVGTVAGDDTIFIATSSDADQAKVTEWLGLEESA